MIIEEKVTDYGGNFLTVRRSVAYNNSNDENTLTLDFANGEVVGTSYDFGGIRSSGGGQLKLEELRRFKALLNSFEEL